MIEGKDLVATGAKPGRWFSAALQVANEALAERQSRQEALAAAMQIQPPPPLRLLASGSLDFHRNIEPQNEDEAANAAAVVAPMVEPMRTPTARAGTVMPDAKDRGPPEAGIPAR